MKQNTRKVGDKENHMGISCFMGIPQGWYV